MSSVLLVGAGSIGIRYLQGLACSGDINKVIVLERSHADAILARNRWDLTNKNTDLNLNWLVDQSDISDSVDLVIVSTTADTRLSVISELVGIVDANFWILEKVISQSTCDLEKVKSELSFPLHSWVNTPRRLMYWHKCLKEHLESSFPLKIVKSGAMWGLACNSIHFIDLVSWWTNETLVSVNCTGLSQVWFESKRQGFYEVTGDLIATFSGGSVLTVCSDPKAQDDQITVITRQGVVWTIDESKGVARSTEGAEVLGQLEYQSALTSRLVTGILEAGSCELPTLQESSQMHAIFLDAMLKHWNDSKGLNDTHVPIT